MPEGGDLCRAGSTTGRRYSTRCKVVSVGPSDGALEKPTAVPNVLRPCVSTAEIWVEPCAACQEMLDFVVWSAKTYIDHIDPFGDTMPMELADRAWLEVDWAESSAWFLGVDC